MKTPIFIYLVLLVQTLAIIGCASCSQNEEVAVNEDIKTKEPVEGMRIAWDYRSMQKIVPQDGRVLSWSGYPRLKRLKDQSLFVTYEAQGNVECVVSTDEGQTWTMPTILFEKQTQTNDQGQSTTVNMSNGELIELSDGTLLSACNYRPVEGGIVPFAIAVKRSTDKGQTWSEAQVIYEAETYFHDGCWEPSFLELPNGEVQVYFANEKPFTSSDEQNISMLRSHDKGITWDEQVVTVCFRAHHRDGMPVPVLLNDEIVVAIEDNVSGQFKPYTVRTTIQDNWSSPVLAQSSQRDRALTEAYPNQVYAGAPYLVPIPGGTVLSYQTTYQRGNNWELSTMEVAIGDAEGRNFSKQSRPFSVPLDREAKWNSVAMWDEQTVVAATSTSFNSPSCEVWIIKGHIIPSLSLQSANIQVDGSIDDDEWAALPIFVGHTSANQISSGLKRVGEHLVIAAKLDLDENANNQQAEVNFLVDAGNYCTEQAEKGLFKWVIQTDGSAHSFKGSKGSWIKQDFIGELKVSEKQPNIFEIELKIPFQILNWEEVSEFRFNTGIGYLNTEGEKVTEWMANSNGDASFSWCSVTLE
ncbi:exo-alpha-sialidase [Carboxylicivirga sp. A043]|uniref:sialidase family protein n=1 Tax=Carboxylicivirga litoralis TaxID=2816963 RepID=UPI0021CAF159|nr:sialidase family protein [Carboxylicivirga sp. A043]MCU4155639.1 exo-alpha-sialidase [Carboxylicivirga sp. A043]